MVSTRSRILKQSFRRDRAHWRTLSWLWFSVLRLKTLAGIVNFSASAANADAGDLHCLNPWWAAEFGFGEGHEVGRKSIAHGRLTQQHELAIEKVADVRHGDLECVHGKANMPAVEVAAMEDLARVGIDQGVVAGPR